MTRPEEQARAGIDRLLAAAGWAVQSYAQADNHASSALNRSEDGLAPVKAEVWFSQTDQRY